MLITLNGSPGNSWNLEYAPSLGSTQWTSLTTVTANAAGEASVTDTPPDDASSRFYRAGLVGSVPTPVVGNEISAE